MKHYEAKTVFKDPVCKMPVSRLTAAATCEYQGKTYYFCAECCRDEFERAPGKYVAKWPRRSDKSN